MFSRRNDHSEMAVSAPSKRRLNRQGTFAALFLEVADLGSCWLYVGRQWGEFSEGKGDGCAVDSGHGDNVDFVAEIFANAMFRTSLPQILRGLLEKFSQFH